EAEQLLGPVAPALGPEPRAAATGHHDGVEHGGESVPEILGVKAIRLAAALMSPFSERKATPATGHSRRRSREPSGRNDAEVTRRWPRSYRPARQYGTPPLRASFIARAYHSSSSRNRPARLW